MADKILTTPVKAEDIEDIRIGDVVYLTGCIVTARDSAHRRMILSKQEIPVDLQGGAIFHAGPIVQDAGNGKFEMVSIGPTTSMRMEKLEKDLLEQTGVKLIIGKGGMGANTAAACKEQKALHLLFPAGCAVLGATQVEEIEKVEWLDLGMPEALWVCRVKNFGPLIVTIDTEGNNLFENNKAIFNARKDEVYNEIASQVKFN